MERSLLWIFCVFLSLSAWAHESAEIVKKVRPSLFKIYSVSQKVSHRTPWKKSAMASSTGTGFLIGENLILTNAHVVAHGKSLYAQMDRDPELRRAYVKHVAHDVDLALISLVNPKPIAQLKPLRFADKARLGESVLTIGFPTGGEELSVTKGVISRFDYRLYAHSGFSKRLLFQVDSAINHGNSGGPVFLNDKVLGVAFQAKMSDQNIGYVIPFLVVKRFLEDVKDGTYDKQPSTGLHIKKWASREGGNGVEVTYVEKGSSTDGVLDVGDHLLMVGDKRVGTDGKVSLLGERVSFKALFGLTQVGSSLKFKVLRKGQEKNLVAQVKAYTPHFSSINFERNPRYASYGGLVFTPLSTNWIREQGKKKKCCFINYVQGFSKFDPSFSHVEEFVILSNLLVQSFVPHARPFMEGVVESINDEKVRSLEHFVMLFEETKRKNSKIKFYNKREVLFVKTQDLIGLNKRVREISGLKKDKELDKPVDGAVRKEDLFQ